VRVGVFLPSATGGYVLSNNAPTVDVTYAFQLEVTRLAEDLDYDFSMSMIKHHGFGGQRRFWDEGLDSITLMAGLAAETTRIGIIPSIPLLAVHPATAARQAVTVNDIAEGRFALNIVTGWSQSEYVQYGLWPGDEHYSRRYEFADEYARVMKDFWSTGRSNFKGEFFQMENAECFPTPPTGDIPLVCAGQSDRGIRFAAENGSYAFVTAETSQLAEMRKKLDGFAAAANRPVGMLPLYMVILGQTDAEAEERYQHILEGADMESMRNLVGDAGSGTGGTATRFVQRTIFAAQTALIGSYETVGTLLRGFADEGIIDGVMCTFLDYIEDTRAFGEHVLPRLHAGAAVCGTARITCRGGGCRSPR
jgi:pyrimidine oxygenase